jgi:hypothetical protein
MKSLKKQRIKIKRKTHKILDKKKYKSKVTVIEPSIKTSNRRNSEFQSYRGSQYKGVSINGGKFQVFFIFKNKKYYMGQLSSEVDAAKLYDVMCLLHNGVDARTNFSYSTDDIVEILERFSEL